MNSEPLSVTNVVATIERELVLARGWGNTTLESATSTNLKGGPITGGRSM